ncbi:hypothetical protein K9L97_01555 [Candidatus Woesearchaeota archaeon]|nr:hypothetical protein [Candidatus Woesearchaeota archaeon]
MVLNFIKNGFDIVRGYTGLLGSDGSMTPEEINQKALEQLNNPLQIEQIQDTTKTQQNKVFENEIQMLKELGYVGKDDQGVYVQLKSVEQTKKDFSNVNANKFMKSWNEWKYVNNITTTLESLMDPARAQSTQNQDFTPEYFQKNEITPNVVNKYSKLSFEEFDWKDISKEEKENMNNPTKLFVLNYLNQDKLGNSVSSNPDVQEPGTKFYLNESVYKPIVEMILNSDGKDLTELEKQLSDYYSSNTRLQGINGELRDRNNKLKAKNDSLSQTINEGIFRATGGVGLTTKGNLTGYLSAELENIMLGLSVTEGTSSQNSQPFSEPYTDEDGFTINNETKYEFNQKENLAWDILAGYRIMNNLTPFLTIGDKIKTSSLHMSSKKSASFGGPEAISQDDPDMKIYENKFHALRFGAGVLVNPTDYLAIKLAANWSVSDNPEFSATLGANFGDLEKRLPKIPYNEALDAVLNTAKQIKPELMAIYTNEGPGAGINLGYDKFSITGMYVPGEENFLGGGLNYDVHKNLSAGIIAGQSKLINEDKKLELGAQLQAKVSEAYKLLAGAKTDTKFKNPKAYIGVGINPYKVFK